MVYCSLSCFKVAANAGQTRPRGGVFQRACQGATNTAVAAIRAPSASEKAKMRLGVPLSLPNTLPLWFMNYTNSLRGDTDQCNNVRGYISTTPLKTHEAETYRSSRLPCVVARLEAFSAGLFFFFYKILFSAIFYFYI